MANNYANACSEVLTLFDNFLSIEELNKIPKEQIEYIRKKSDPEYKYEIDYSKDLMGQNISKEAKAIILSLYKNYFASNEEKLKIDYYVMINDKKRYLEKVNAISNNNEKKVLNNENIELHSEKIELNNEQEQVDETSLILKENIFKKILKKFFNFINKIVKK